VFLVYIVLWIIIPKATTVKQKLEMMGEEEYIKSIRTAVSDNVANAKSKSDIEVSQYQSSTLLTEDLNFDDKKQHYLHHHRKTQPPSKNGKRAF